MKKPDLGDKALRKILDSTILTTGDVIKETNIIKTKDTLMTVRRHAIGMLSAVEKELSLYSAKCNICYENHGFLTKCVCENKGKINE